MKDRSAFSKMAASKDGLCSQCKACRAEHQRSPAGKAVRKKACAKYYQSNKVGILKKQQSPAGKAASKKSGAKRHATIRGYLQNIFAGMVYRCNNREYKWYHRYGGRGIAVCFKSSNEFIDYVVDELEVDPRGLNLTRINYDGNYEAGNIKFISRLKKVRNR